MIVRQETTGVACPGDAQWEAFLNGQLDDAAVAVLDGHLRDCAACLATVDRLSSHWTLAERMAADRPPGLASGAVADARVAEIASRLLQQPPTGSGSGNGTAAIPTAIPRIPGIEDLEPVASGGMGVVYRGRDVALGRTVGVKVLRDAGMLSESARARARRESQLCARIEHPNIVAVHAAGEIDGLPYLVMSWIVGPSLQKRVEAEGPLAAREASAIARDIARGLERVHAYGVVHRDLKPDNILLSTKSDPPTPILIDFGLARTEDTTQQLTRTTTVLGTPGFMAPEQTGFDPDLGEVGPATDVHGLGAVLFAMLTGKPPYAAATATATMQLASRGELSEPAALDRRAPEDLRTIVVKCLQTSPARRYRSAGELADDLERFLEGRPIQARPIGLPERLSKWARRRPVAAVASGLATLLVLLGVGGTVYHVLELERANAEITRSRDLADEAITLAARSMERLTGESIRKMLLRGKALDEEDRAYLQQLVVEFEKWPLGSDPVQGLRLRQRGFDKLAGLFYDLGQYEDALACQQREIATLATIDELLPDDPETLKATLYARYRMQYSLYQLNRSDEAIESLRGSIALLEAAPADFPRRERDLIDMRFHMGVFLCEKQNFDEGLPVIEEAFAALRDLRTRQPDNVELALQELQSLRNAQLFDAAAGREEARRRRIERLVTVAEEALARFGDHRHIFTLKLSEGLSLQMSVANDKGRSDEAIAIAERRRDLSLETLADPDLAGSVVVDADLRLAGLYREQGRRAEAIPLLDEAVDLADAIATESPAVYDNAMLLARALFDRGAVYAESDALQEAGECFEQIVTLLEPWLNQHSRATDTGMLLTAAQEQFAAVRAREAAASDTAAAGAE
jgi:tetratricopeptide (TPR) repeat protein